MADNTVTIDELPLAVSLDGTEQLPIAAPDGNGGYTTKRTTTGAVATVGTNAEFVLVSANPLLPNARILAGAAGEITVSDGGADENITIGLAATGVAGATYGDGTHVPQIAVDSEGRITSASNVAITNQGTVKTVGLAVPVQFDVTGSPVTDSGTLTAAWKTQNANTVLAGPASGSAADPTFRALTDADMPGGTTGTGAVVLAASPALTGTPTAPTQTAGDNSTKLATTAYVQAAVSGTTTLPASKYATAATLPSVSYANGASGVGATLTATANGVLTIDGNTPSVGDEVLVKNQTAPLQNGIYSVTATGSGSAPFVLTRATYYDEPAQIDLGDTTFVTAGSTLASTSWTQNGTENPVIGTDPITFAQTAGPGSFVAGNGISISGTSIAIDTSVTADLTSAQTLTNKTLVTPDLGTPSAINLTNATGLPLAALPLGTTDLPILGNGGDASSYRALPLDGPGVTRVLPTANGGYLYCADIAAVTSASSTFFSLLWLADSVRFGWFQWLSGNQSSKVSSDAGQGIYIAPASAPSGSSGCWERMVSFGHLFVRYWGAIGDNSTNNQPAVQSAVNFAQSLTSAVIHFDPGLYIINGTITATTQGVVLAGATGNATTLIGSALTGPVIWLQNNACGAIDLTIAATTGRQTAGFTALAAGIIVASPDGSSTQVRRTLISRCIVTQQPGHGIVCSKEFEQSIVQQNLVTLNGGHGIVMDDGTAISYAMTVRGGQSTIRENTITNNVGNGIVLGGASSDYLMEVCYNDIFGNAATSGVRLSAYQVDSLCERADIHDNGFGGLNVAGTAVTSGAVRARGQIAMLSGNRHENCASPAILLDSITGAKVIDPHCDAFSGNPYNPLIGFNGTVADIEIDSFQQSVTNVTTLVTLPSPDVSRWRLRNGSNVWQSDFDVSASFNSQETPISLSLNTAAKVGFSSSPAYGYVLVSPNTSAAGGGLFFFRVGTFNACYKLSDVSSGGISDASTAVLTGSTGTAGHFTISGASDGNLYIEDRVQNATYMLTFLGVQGGTPAVVSTSSP